MEENGQNLTITPIFSVQLSTTIAYHVENNIT